MIPADRRRAGLMTRTELIEEVLSLRELLRASEDRARQARAQRYSEHGGCDGMEDEEADRGS